MKKSKNTGFKLSKFSIFFEKIKHLSSQICKIRKKNFLLNFRNCQLFWKNLKISHLKFTKFQNFLKNSKNICQIYINIFEFLRTSLHFSLLSLSKSSNLKLT